MNNTIYQVLVNCIYEDDAPSFITWEFSTEDKAYECMDYLYNNRFKMAKQWGINPFSGYSEDEQKNTDTRKISEIKNGEEKISSFSVIEMYSYSELNVSMETKEMDTDNNSWEL